MLRAFQCFAAGPCLDATGKARDLTAPELLLTARGYRTSGWTTAVVAPSFNGAKAIAGAVAGVVAYRGGLYCLAEVSSTLVKRIASGELVSASAALFAPGEAGNPTRGTVPSVYYLAQVVLDGEPPAQPRGGLARFPVAQAIVADDKLTNSMLGDEWKGASYSASHMATMRIRRAALDLTRVASLDFSQAEKLVSQALAQA